MSENQVLFLLLFLVAPIHYITFPFCTVGWVHPQKANDALPTTNDNFLPYALQCWGFVESIYV